MTHWSDRYVGQPYIPGVADCAVLAQQVAAEVFGIAVDLPTAHATTYRSQSRQILSLKDAYAERVEQPFDGCPVLLMGRGCLCHIGVMCWLAHEWWVLHADQTSGYVVRQRLRDVTRLHFRLEGYYRWL